jgi:hypothetical protein
VARLGVVEDNVDTDLRFIVAGMERLRMSGIRELPHEIAG